MHVIRRKDRHPLAASMKSACWLVVNNGSGNSRNHSLSTLVTLLMSDVHSSASRFTESRSGVGDQHVIGPSASRQAFERKEREALEASRPYLQTPRSQDIAILAF